jgi:phage shock protein PspC (stress-responsive transcriptional regulator)
MTNQPADAARPDQAPEEPTLAPPAPPPGPLWPSLNADSAPTLTGATTAPGDVFAGSAPEGTPASTAAGGAPEGTATGGAPEGTATGGAPEGIPASGAPAGAPTSGAAGNASEGAPATGSTSGAAGASGGDQGTGAGAGATGGAGGWGGQFGPGGQFAPGFMAKYGLVRPVTGRHFAGVCAAVGRATNTDPILWRVLFAVLTLFGGVGLLAYLIGWLLIPADGDTASPVEAVLGRGTSRTSAPVAVIGTIVAILVFALVASEGLRPAVVGALVVLGAAVLLSRGTLQRPGQPNNTPFGAQPYGAPMVPPSPHAPWTATAAAPPTVVPPVVPTVVPPVVPPVVPTVVAPEAATVPMPADRTESPASELTVQKSPLAEEGVPADTDPADGPESRTDDARQDEVAPATAHAVISEPDETPTLPQPPQPPTPPYGQAFAPHGPFAPPGPYPPAFGPVPQTQTRRLPLYGPYPPIPGAGLPWDAPVSVDPMSHYPGMPYSGPPAPKPKVKRPKSRLGKVTVYATAIALGTLATVHLLGASIAGSAYFAVALTVVGLGLVAGAWVGRARLLIPLGIALSIGLLASTASTMDGPHRAGRPEVFNPTTIIEVNENNPYARDTGDLTLDFTQVDFNNQQISFEASNDVGRIEIILPPNVDVTVRAKVEVGDANVFDSHWGGISDQWRTVVDHGDDGPNSGGSLQLTISVDVGNLEVHR